MKLGQNPRPSISVERPLFSSSANIEAVLNQIGNNSTLKQANEIQDFQRNFEIIRDHQLKKSILEEVIRMDLKLNRHKSVPKQRDEPLPTRDIKMLKFKRPVYPAPHTAAQTKPRIFPRKRPKSCPRRKFVSNDTYIRALIEKFEGSIKSNVGKIKNRRVVQRNLTSLGLVSDTGTLNLRFVKRYEDVMVSAGRTQKSVPMLKALTRNFENTYHRKQYSS